MLPSENKLLEERFGDLVNNPKGLERLLKFGIEWFLPSAETKKRITFVNAEIINVRNCSDYCNRYYDRPIMPIKVIHILAGFRKIDDSMLFDFVWDNALIPLWASSKKEDARWDRALDPALNVFLDFLSTSEYVDFIIAGEISGERTIKLGGKIVSITQKEIKQHINRMKSHPFTSEHILDIEDDLVVFEELRYEKRMRLKDELLEGVSKKNRSGKRLEFEDKVNENGESLSNDGNVTIDNKFCENMPISIPQEHFNVFALNNSKNGKPFLTTEQYHNFINRAFKGNSGISKQKFNNTKKEHSVVVHVFYDFYLKTTDEYFNSSQNRDIFMRLLTNNFIGWDFNSVKNNFSRKPLKTII